MKFRFVLFLLACNFYSYASIDSVYYGGYRFLLASPEGWKTEEKKDDLCSDGEWNIVFTHPVSDPCANAALGFRFEKYPRLVNKSASSSRIKKPEVQAGFKEIYGHHAVFYSSTIANNKCRGLNSKRPIDFSFSYQFWLNDSTILVFVLNATVAENELTDLEKKFDIFCHYFFGQNAIPLKTTSLYWNDIVARPQDTIPIGKAVYRFALPNSWQVIEIYNTPDYTNRQGRKLEIQSANQKGCFRALIEMETESGNTLRLITSTLKNDLTKNSVYGTPNLPSLDNPDTTINNLDLRISVAYRSAKLCEEKAVSVNTYYFITSSDNSTGWLFTFNSVLTSADPFEIIRQQDALTQFVFYFISQNDFTNFKAGE